MTYLFAVGVTVGILAGAWVYAGGILGFVGFAGFLGWATYFAAGGGKKGIISTLCSNLSGVFWGVITKYLIVNVSILVSFIFIVIGIEMIISNVKEKDNKVIISLIGFLVFGFSVSIDSFTTGIGLNVINSNYLEVSLIFSIVSGSFTYFGLILGNRLKFYFGRLAASVGGIVLIMLGIYYFFR